MDSDAIKNEKKALRREILARRAAMGPQLRAAASAEICRRLKALPELGDAAIILSYMPMAEETEVTAFHAWARSRGIRIALPVTGDGGAMEAWIPESEEALQPDKYGIPAPIPAQSTWVPPETLGAVLVPCVAFTAEGGRLGHGGGYYDRYLSRCPQAVRILPAFEAQCAASVPAGEYDLPVRIVVTERRLLRL